MLDLAVLCRIKSVLNATHDHSCVQVFVHLLKCSFCLLEKAKCDALAKFALVLVVVHFKDLLKGSSIDAVAAFG